MMIFKVLDYYCHEAATCTKRKHFEHNPPDPAKAINMQKGASRCESAITGVEKTAAWGTTDLTQQCADP